MSTFCQNKNNDIYLNREHQDLALGWKQQPIMSVNVSCATMLSLSHIDWFIVNLKRCKKKKDDHLHQTHLLQDIMEWSTDH